MIWIAELDNRPIDKGGSIAQLVNICCWDSIGQ